MLYREAKQSHQDKQYGPDTRPTGNSHEQGRGYPTEHQQKGQKLDEPASGRGERTDSTECPGRPCSDGDYAHPDSCSAHITPLSSGFSTLNMLSPGCG
jgi:hypothetical protein